MLRLMRKLAFMHTYMVIRTCCNISEDKEKQIIFFFNTEVNYHTGVDNGSGKVGSGSKILTDTNRG